MSDAVAIAIRVRLICRILCVGPDPEHAVDAANDAADRATDHRADRAGGVVAHIGAMGDAVGNALRLRRERRNQRCGDNSAGCEHNLELHVENPFLMSRRRHMSANEGHSAALAWRRGAAATIRSPVRQNDHTSGARRRWNFDNGQSMTPAQNNAHHTITGCKASRGA